MARLVTRSIQHSLLSYFLLLSVFQKKNFSSFSDSLYRRTGMACGVLPPFCGSEQCSWTRQAHDRHLHGCARFANVQRHRGTRTKSKKIHLRNFLTSMSSASLKTIKKTQSVVEAEI